MKARFTRGVKPLQTDGNCGGRAMARTVFTALLMTFSVTVQAQAQAQTADAGPESIPESYYRAELVILERIVEPGAINEQMTDREVATTPETEEILRAVSRDGTAETTLELAPTSELHLNSAAQRLERSGRYRVLVAAGWYEAFPPDYKGQPLRVAVGDWLDGADTREIEGTITIDRQRYLHVDVHLNHWQLGEAEAPAEMMAEEPAQGEAVAPVPETAPAATSDQGEDASMATDSELQPLKTAAPLELLTWIRETRRMRSEEIHFLDSPTVGVLVFFKRIEASE